MLVLSPPLRMEAHWFAGHVAYSIAQPAESFTILAIGMLNVLEAEWLAQRGGSLPGAPIERTAPGRPPLLHRPPYTHPTW